MKNKILIFAVSDDSHFKEPVIKSLQNANFEVFVFNYRSNSNIEKIYNGLALLIPRFKKYFDGIIVKSRNRRLISLTKKTKASFLLVSKGETIDFQTIEKIKSSKTITINWFSDLIDYIPGMSIILTAYDFVFSHDLDDLEKYKSQINGFYLPYGAPIINKHPSFEKRNLDITFIGVWSKDREELIYSLRNYKPSVWGNDKWLDSRVKEFYKGSWLTPPQVLKVLSDSKIAINIHQVPYDVATTLNVRSFEATGSGALLITDRRRDLPKLFKVTGRSKEVLSYSNLKEVKKIVVYYLKNDKERIAIAERGFKRALKDHNYDRRIQEMFKMIKASRLTP